MLSLGLGVVVPMKFRKISETYRDLDHKMIRKEIETNETVQ